MLRLGRYTVLALSVLCLASLHCNGGGGATTEEGYCADGLDNDGDGLIDCADQADCAADPACAGSCNYNGVCEAGENMVVCPQDCQSAVCGNGFCEAGETAATCPADCSTGPVCGNGTCEAGETQQTCPADCNGGPVCGNGQCETGEDSTNCPADCSGSCDCDYCDFTAVQESASSTPSKMYYQGINSGSLPADVLQIEIWPSYGGPSTPGTYDLTQNGNDNYADCGLCPLLLMNQTASEGPEKIFYPHSANGGAGGGTIEITSIGGIGSTFAATLHNVTFVEVTIDPSTAMTTPVPGGETFCLDGYSFSQTVQEGSPCPGNCVGDTLSDFSIVNCETGQPASFGSLAAANDALWIIATHDW